MYERETSLYGCFAAVPGKENTRALKNNLEEKRVVISESMADILFNILIKLTFAPARVFFIENFGKIPDFKQKNRTIIEERLRRNYDNNL